MSCVYRAKTKCAQACFSPTTSLHCDPTDYNNNYNQNVEVAEICEQSYERAAKCEKNVKSSSVYFYPDTSGCDYINSILPRLAKASNKAATGSSSGSGSGSAATAFAVIFFLTSCILGAYSFFLYRKIHRAKVNLAQSEGMTMA